MMSNPSLIDIAMRALNLPRDSFSITRRPAIGHQTNRLYDVRAQGKHYIAKEYLQSGEESDCARREFDALHLLAPLDLAPQPIFFEPARGAIVIYEFLEGEMWDRRKPAPNELRALARAFLKLHELPTTDLWLSRSSESWVIEIIARFRARFQTYAQWADENFAPARGLARALLELLARRRARAAELDAQNPRLYFCRSDPRFANILARPDGRLGFVDWEDCGLRDPARELADVLLAPNQEDLLAPDEWRAFVEPYLDFHSARDSTVWQRTEIYLQLFPIFWLSVLLAHGAQRARENRLRGWQINGMPARTRLQRYYARAHSRDPLDFAAELERAQTLEFFPED